ncbi:hypothetical protein V5N11_010671 [Cardamine amara subsp. amara]|uniref:Uncharacterized protein n=1 Tax=Cardamine amara subsp. amara TaxID=228776 RepID=A0ABD1AV97_CARAN
MGCGISRPETDEGGDLKIVNRPGSIGKGSETTDSLISDKELLESKNGEKTSKEEEDECKDEEEKGDELKISPASPSFRIYCVFSRDPNDSLADDMQPNKYISDENKKGKRQEAVGMKIRKRFYNVKKLLIPPNVPSSATNRG